MIIQLNKEKIQGLENVIKSHDFKTFLGFTSTFRGFEGPNLDNQVKMSLLKKLSTENWRDVPCFVSFWDWFRKKHGMQLATQICTFMYPKDEKERQKNINRMRNCSSHDWWDHIKARVYKKWCSILTEMQAVYAVVAGSSTAKLKWDVVASAELDALGVDFVVVTDQAAYPIQIKKDSYSKASMHKQNNCENLSRFSITKKAQKLLEEELNKHYDNMPIEQGILLKYALPHKNQPAYPYLNHFANNFVYFEPKKLIQNLTPIIK